MSLLSTAEQAQLQADFVAAVCDKTCVVSRRATTSGSSGEPLGSYATIATTVCGMRQPTAGELANYAYEIGDKAAWTVLMPIGTDATHQDRLTIEGQTLEVHILLNPRSYEMFHSVIAAEVK